MEKEHNYWQQAMKRRLSRRNLLKSGAVAGAGLVAGLSVLGCNNNQEQQAAPSKSSGTPQANSGQPKSGGILKFGYFAGPGTLYPAASASGYDPLWLFILGDAFVYTASDGSADAASSLAESWQRDDDTTFTFKLRQNVKFHDGTDYDAAAQKAYFEYLMDPQRSKAFGYRGMLDPIKQMEVVDKYTLRFKMASPYPGILANMGTATGVTVSPTAIEKLGPDVQAKPPCTGPFVLKSFTPGGDWVFEKNPNYWRKGLPYLDGITVTEIPDDNVRAAAIQSGQLDLAWFPNPGDITANLKKDPNLVVTESPAGPAIIALNQALPPLDNLKIRQAVASCIDREAILKVVYQGFGQVAKGGLIPPGHWAYKDVSDVMYKFDINQAKQLIKESGLAGPISLKITGADSPSDRRSLGELVKGWLDEAGFSTTLEFFSSTEMNRRMYDEGSYHLTVTTSGLRTDPDGEFSIYSTSKAYYNPGRKSQDPVQKQLDDLVVKGNASYDQNERKKAYDEIQRLQTQYVMGEIILCYRLGCEVHRTNVKGTDKEYWIASMCNIRPRFLWKE